MKLHGGQPVDDRLGLFMPSELEQSHGVGRQHLGIVRLQCEGLDGQQRSLGMPAGGVIIPEPLSYQALNQLTAGLADEHPAIVRMRSHEGVVDHIGFETDLPGILRIVELQGDFDEQGLRPQPWL